MIKLEPATFECWADLYAWRNDEETRRQSLQRDSVPLEAHLKWLKAALESPDLRLYMARDPMIGYMGMARLQRKPGTTSPIEIGLVVAPKHRGRGCGKLIILAATVAALEWTPDAMVRADVREENVASLRAFAACDFVVRKMRKASDGMVADLVYKLVMK